MNRARFDKVVKEVLRTLPPALRKALDTVQIVVQEYPTPQQIESVGLEPGETLYGIFEGESLLEKRWSDPNPFPDRVVLFRGPLERDFPHLEDLEREIRTTVVHELGHFFGFEEKDLEERGYS